MAARAAEMTTSDKMATSDKKVKKRLTAKEKLQLLRENWEAKAMGTDGIVMLPLRDTDEAYMALQEMGVRMDTFWNSVLRTVHLPGGWYLHRYADIRTGELRNKRHQPVATFIYQNRNNCHCGEVVMVGPNWVDACMDETDGPSPEAPQTETE